MTEKSRFRVKKIMVEFAPETAGVFCGGFEDGINRKLSYGRSYPISEEGHIIMTNKGETIGSIPSASAKQLEKLKYGKRE